MAKRIFAKKSRMENSGELRPNQSRAPDERGGTGLPAEAQALLHAISGKESGGDYNVVYGQTQFNNYDDHPRIYRLIEQGPNKGKYSSAAGRYQMIGTTWDRAKAALGLSDFSPASQDKAAWWAATQQYAADNPGRDLLMDLRTGTTMPAIAKSLAKQWTSLPGGIEQGQDHSQFEQVYTAALANHGAMPAVAPTAPTVVTPASPPLRMVAARAGTPSQVGSPAPAPRQFTAENLRPTPPQPGGNWVFGLQGAGAAKVAPMPYAMPALKAAAAAPKATASTYAKPATAMPKAQATSAKPTAAGIQKVATQMGGVSRAIA